MADPHNIRMIIFDVDGILTDGSILIDDRGVETKRFHVRDGTAIRAAMKLGIKVGILTGRSSQAVTLRAGELGIEYLIQGSQNKAIGLETLCQLAGVTEDEVAFMGDDLADLPAMLRSGFKITVADGADEVLGIADYTTAAVGGRAAVREAIEFIIKAQGRWEEVLEHYGV